MKLLTLLVVPVFLSAFIHMGCTAQPFDETQNLLPAAAGGGAAVAIAIEAVVAQYPAYERAGIGGAAIGIIGFLSHNYLQEDSIVKWIGPCVLGATVGFIKGRYFEPAYKFQDDKTGLLIGSTVGGGLFAMSGVGAVYFFNWLRSSQ